MTDDKNELEYCENVAAELDDYVNSVIYNYKRAADIIARARAAARAQGYERGRADAQSDIGSALAMTQDYLNKSAASLRELQSKYETLAAAAQRMKTAARNVVFLPVETHECNHYDVICDLQAALSTMNAALGPAPAPEEKS